MLLEISNRAESDWSHLVTVDTFLASMVPSDIG